MSLKWPKRLNCPCSSDSYTSLSPSLVLFYNTLVLQKRSGKNGWQKWVNIQQRVAWNISNLRNVTAFTLERASQAHTHTHIQTQTHKLPEGSWRGRGVVMCLGSGIFPWIGFQRRHYISWGTVVAVLLLTPFPPTRNGPPFWIVHLILNRPSMVPRHNHKIAGLPWSEVHASYSSGWCSTKAHRLWMRSATLLLLLPPVMTQ